MRHFRAGKEVRRFGFRVWMFKVRAALQMIVGGSLTCYCLCHGAIEFAHESLFIISKCRD